MSGSHINFEVKWNIVDLARETLLSTERGVTCLPSLFIVHDLTDTEAFLVKRLIDNSDTYQVEYFGYMYKDNETQSPL